jgi:transposase-like protein
VAWHHTEQYANNRIEADHAQLKRWLRPMRGVKTMIGLRVVAAGHAFVQNLHRGHYEIATDQPLQPSTPAAFRELARAVWTVIEQPACWHAPLTPNTNPTVRGRSICAAGL